MQNFRERGRFWSVALAVFLAFVPAASVVAQPATTSAAQATSITGSIRDGSGRPVGGAVVSVSGPATATATSADDGSFAVRDLPAGTYNVSVKKSGFATLNDEITVSAESRQPLTFTLAKASLESLREIGRVVTARSSTSLNTSTAATNGLTTSDYISRGQSQVTNILEELPGVELQRFSSGGAPGANTVAALRGADPSETQTLIDGHPVSGGPQGNYLIQFLNPLILGSIEVDKGPGAFGNTIANQVNGTINYRTPPITQTLGGLVDFGYDSYNGSTYAARVSDTFGKVGFLAGYARFGTPGYNTQPILSLVSNGTPAPGVPASATITTAFPASQTFDNRSENFKLAYNFSPSTSITLGYLGLQTYVDYTSTLTTLEPFTVAGAPCASCGKNAGNSGLPSFNAPGYNQLTGTTVFGSSTFDNLYPGNYELDNEPLFTGDFRTTVGQGSLLARYYAGSIGRSISDPLEAFQILQCDNPSCSFAIAQKNGDVSSAFYQQQTDLLHGGDFEYALPIGPNTYTLSFDSHGDKTSSCNGSNYFALRCSVNGLLQTSNTIGARGSLHFDKLGAQFATYFSNSTFVGSRIDPRLGFTYQANPNAIVRLSGGSSYVAPSAGNATNFTGSIARNTLSIGPGVKPETSLSFDLGTDIRTGSDGKLTFDAYVTRLFNRFSSYTNQLAAPIVVNGQTVKQINVSYNGGTALEKGLELTYVKAPRYGLGASVDFNLLRTFGSGDNYALNNFNPAGTIYGNTLDGQQFPGYPYSHGRVELNYQTKNDLRPAVGMTYYGALNSFNEPGFALFDASFDAKITGGVHLIASMQNVFNHDDYRTFGIYNFGYNPPAPPGGGGATTLYFAPPRMLTLQLVKEFGPGAQR